MLILPRFADRCDSEPSFDQSRPIRWRQSQLRLRETRQVRDTVRAKFRQVARQMLGTDRMPDVL